VSGERRPGSPADAELTRKTLTALGWSQARLAVRLGYTQGTVSHWLTERRPIPLLAREWMEVTLAHQQVLTPG
jgi:transcriptional regulator with XRE-family HTH domain